MNGLLAQVTAKHFCAGIILRDDVVRVAAPIVAYMVGWARSRVRDYCASKGWRVVCVSSQDRSGGE